MPYGITFVSRRQGIKASDQDEPTFQHLVDLRVISPRDGAFDLLECETVKSRVKEAAQHLGLLPIPAATAEPEPGPVVVRPPASRLPN